MATDRVFGDNRSSGSSQEEQLIEAAFREVFGRCPKEIGRYRIIRQVGAGGMGVVYEAEQAQPQRRVAVKLTRPSATAAPRYARMLRREIQVLARLRHPCIAQIFDAGHTPEGQQYSVMEFVDGVALDAYCRGRSLSLRDKLTLFIRVCDAVRYAHQRGVIHRDLKPANILVDGDGIPHVLDFGLAQLTDPEADAARTISQAQGWVGTLRYMSPEQIQTDKTDLDIRTDIYSLGVILYQMLTDRFPYDVLGNMRDVLDNILSAEPIRPRTFSPLVDDELETIVLKCLSKERERRYQTAGDLARDIEHYLAGEAIEAKRDSTFYVLRKTLRRYRLPVGVAAGFMCLLAASSVLAWVLLGTATRARTAETASRQRAEQSEQTALHNERMMRRHLYAAHMNLALWAWEGNDQSRALALLEGQKPRQGEEDIRDFVWGCLWLLCHRGPERGWHAHDDGVMNLAYSHDGSMLATAGLSSSRTDVKVWDATTGRKLLSIDEGVRSNCVAFSPDGLLLVTGGWDSGSDKAGNVRLHDVGTGRELTVLRGHTMGVGCATFSQDGRLLASASGDWWAQKPGEVIVWDLQTRQPLCILRGHSQCPLSTAFSPDGRLLASGGRDDVVRLWDVASGQEIGVLDGHSADVRCVRFSPDGSLLATASEDQTARIWTVRDRRVKKVLTDHKFQVNTVAFSPDGQTLATGSSDHTVKLWTVPDGILKTTLKGHKAWVMSLAFSPDGVFLATGAVPGDPMVRLWDADSETQEVARTLHGPAGRLACLQLSPDGAKLAAAWSGEEYQSPVQEAIVWEVPSWRQCARLAGEDLGTLGVFSPDATMLATVRTEGRTVAIRRLPADQPRDLCTDHAGAIVSTAISPGGQTLATGDELGTVKLWDTATLAKLADISAHEHPAQLMFLPDGSKLATWSPDEPDVKLWELSPARQCAALNGSVGGVSFALSSPDSSVLATVSPDQIVRIWDINRGTLQASFDDVKPDTGRRMIFSPDGTALAGWRQVPAHLLVWDVRGRKPRFFRTEHTQFLNKAVFSPQGGTLATGDWQGGLRFLDAFTGEQQAYIRASRNQLDHLQFSPDGRFLVTGSRDGTVKILEAAAITDQAEPVSAVASQSARRATGTPGGG